MSQVKEFLLELPRLRTCSSCDHWCGSSMWTAGDEPALTSPHSIILTECEVTEEFTAGSFSCSKWKEIDG